MTRFAARGGPPEPDAPSGAPDAGRLEIRAAGPRDLTSVAAIESRAFTNPWSRRTFYALLDRPGVGIWVVADAAAGVVAYAVLWCILDEGELANIAVREDRRGRGIGSRLLDWVIDRARERRVRRVHLEVRASNERALALYRRRGFREVGRRRDYYDSPREDALVLTLKLDD